jgi:hypothetical protein
VKSVPLAEEARVVIRMIVVKQTLMSLSEVDGSERSSQGLTYKPPIAKHPIIPHLLFFDNER